MQLLCRATLASGGRLSKPLDSAISLKDIYKSKDLQSPITNQRFPDDYGKQFFFFVSLLFVFSSFGTFIIQWDKHKKADHYLSINLCLKYKKIL